MNNRSNQNHHSRAKALTMAPLITALLLLAGAVPVRAAVRVVPVGGNPFGRTYEQWAEDWWRWVLSIPAAENPLLTSTCSLPQQGNVQFIAAPFGSGTVTCDVPVGKGIFFPVSGYLNDWPCPDPSFAPAPGQSLEDFLIQTVQPIIAQIQDIKLTIDGKSAGDMFAQRVTTHLFTFTGDTSLLALDPCITGQPQAAVADGFYVMVIGLGLGQHTLKVSFNVGGTAFEITNLITIVNR